MTSPGVVEESKADGFDEGDEVFGWALTGALGGAGRRTGAGAIAPQAGGGLSHEQAAAIPRCGRDGAARALRHGRPGESGQSAVVAGAAGGVGHFGVQLANLARGKVTGTGSAHNRDFVLGLGAEATVDYTEQDVGEAVSDVDVAFDSGWGRGDRVARSHPGRGGRAGDAIANAPPEEAAEERGARALSCK